jgi:ElaB/YqjD/DUF883 family membrane-anchored ribosome-binding protein
MAMNASVSYSDKSAEEIQQEIERTRTEMSHTLRVLERKLSPGEWMDRTLGYFRGAGEQSGEFAVNLGRSIKANPIPVSLLAVGLGWLMCSGAERSERRYTTRHYRDADYSDYQGPIITSSTGATARTAAPEERASRSSYASTSGKPTGAPPAGGSGVKEQAGQAAHHAYEQAEQMAHGARERAGEAAHHAYERAEQMAHEARERAGEATEAARHQAERLSAAAHEQAEWARERVTSLFQEHPLVLAGVGVAIGAALGAGLPPTRREDELMGRKRDELLEQAEALGKEQLAKAEHVAKTAQEAAREEAGRQGLVPETETKANPSQTRSKEERVAGTARETFTKEETVTKEVDSSDFSSSSPSGHKR